MRTPLTTDVNILHYALYRDAARTRNGRESNSIGIGINVAQVHASDGWVAGTAAVKVTADY